MNRRRLFLTGLLAGAAAWLPLPAQPPAPAAADPATPAAARASIDRAVDFLVRTQRDNGAWGTGAAESYLEPGYEVETYYAWHLAAHALAVSALLRVPETPVRRACLERAVHYLLTARVPLRGSGWDNDAMWTWLCGTVAAVDLARDRRFQDDRWRGPVAARGREFVRWLERNQVPEGGFGYYDDPLFTRRPKWATSFATSSVLPALGIALDLGWTEDQAMIDRAARYVRRCRLPNGAFEYDLNPIPRLSGGEHINDVKGSLGRIQVCHWALRRAGDPDTTDDRIRWGLEQFFQHQRFLAIAHMRPVPHEAYYANAGYFFFFGHHYAAECIGLLPAAEREAWHRRLRPLVIATQRRNGSFCDFVDATYMFTASTAYAVMTLQAGL